LTFTPKFGKLLCKDDNISAAMYKLQTDNIKLIEVLNFIRDFIPSKMTDEHINIIQIKIKKALEHK